MEFWLLILGLCKLCRPTEPYFTFWYLHYLVLEISCSDGSSPKKTCLGWAQALNVGIGPGPGLGPSEKVEPEP